MFLKRALLRLFKPNNAVATDLERAMQFQHTIPL